MDTQNEKEVRTAPPKRWFLANIKVYVVVYGLIGLAHFAIGSYAVGIITTIEKRFRIPSRVSGIIMSSWDIGSLACLMLMSYVGRRHKPQWVAMGTLLVSVSCFVWYLPHVLFGPGHATFKTPQETTEGSNCTHSRPEEGCGVSGNEDATAAVIFGIANLILGSGTCVYYTLGVAYLDDNAKKNQVPFLLAVTMCIRMFGPTLGFMMANYSLEVFIDPLVDPGIDSEDPRWIGAWWFGWKPLGFFCIVLAACIFPFPQVLPSASHPGGSDKQELSFKDFKETLSRLLKNKVLIFNSFSATFYMFGMMGYWTFMPKYLETQFHKSASQASFITGSVGLACTALGIVISGCVISLFKPRPKTLAVWNMFVESIDVIGHLSFAFLGCPSDDLQGHWESNSWVMEEDCNRQCGCPATTKYEPLCSQLLKKTFFSPCHAGCTIDNLIPDTKNYTDCACTEGLLVDGICPVDCSTNFIIFMTIVCIMRFTSATGRAGSMIIQFRCVPPEDKSVSIALTEAMIALFAYIPSPIFYGALLDASCLVWGQECGEEGNCWMYNGQTLRFYLNFTSSAFLLVATAADLGVWKNVGGLEIFDKTEGEGGWAVMREKVPFLRKATPDEHPS